MGLLHVKIVSPQRVLVDADVRRVTVPTSLGQIAVLPGHMPLVADVAAGALELAEGNEVRIVHVAGGVVEVRPGNEVVVLADAAEHLDEIDEAVVVAAKERAQQALAESKLSEEEYAVVAANLERDLSRLRVVRKHRPRRGQHIDESVL